MKNLEKQKKIEQDYKNNKNKWIENFRKNKNITCLDKDIINELIDYIEVHENKKITIHFKFKNTLDNLYTQM